MSKITARHILSPDTLAEMDAEFLAGVYDQLGYPPAPELDPATDPFERNYDWLNEPQPGSPLEQSYVTLNTKSLPDWYAVAGRGLRKIALGGSLAGGTDDQVFRAWAENRFVSACQSAGPPGVETLAVMRAATELDADVVRRTAELLQSLPEYGRLDADQLVATSLIAFHWLKAGSSG